MPMAYNSTSVLTNLVTTAWDRKMRLALRHMPQFRQMATVKPVQQTHPGDSVAFHIYGDLTATTATLDEITDPDAVAISNPTRVTVTLEERGNWAVVTKRMEEFSLDGELDSNIANQIAYNQAVSLNEVVQQKLLTGTQVIREAGGSLSTSAAVTSVASGDTLKSRDIRYAVTKLRSAAVTPVSGGDYGVYLHPEVSHDLRIETGATGWRQPHEYVDLSPLYAGEIGRWEGARFIESAFCANSQRGSGSGGTQVRVYDSYVFGQESLAEAVAIEPHLVAGGSVGADPFHRKTTMGWYGLIGWSLFRTQPLWLVETASSVRPNT